MPDPLVPPRLTDPFLDVRGWSVAEAATWVDVLRVRAGGTDQGRIRRAILSAGHVRAGHRVAEIGCGPGALLLELASAVGSTGRVTGYEPQPVLAAAAREAVAAAGLEAVGEVVVAGAESLDLPPGTLDAAVEQTVFVHLPEDLVRGTLDKARSWLRPGGRWVSADQDAGTWTIDHPDRGLTRRLIEFNCDQRYADGWTGRQLLRILREAGYRDVAVEVLVHTDTDPGGFLHGMALRTAQAAQELGVISQEDHDGWVAALPGGGPGQGERAFFSTMNHYVAAGTRP